MGRPRGSQVDGQRLEAARKKKSISMAELARRTGVTPKHLSDVRQEKACSSDDLLGRLSDELGVDSARLRKDKLPRNRSRWALPLSLAAVLFLAVGWQLSSSTQSARRHLKLGRLGEVAKLRLAGQTFQQSEATVVNRAGADQRWGNLVKADGSLFVESVTIRDRSKTVPSGERQSTAAEESDAVVLDLLCQLESRGARWVCFGPVKTKILPMWNQCDQKLQLQCRITPNFGHSDSDAGSAKDVQIAWSLDESCGRLSRFEQKFIRERLLQHVEAEIQALYRQSV